MQFTLRICLAFTLLACLNPTTSRGQQPVLPTSYNQTADTTTRTADNQAADNEAADRIRKIVLHQADSPRALANFVQLTRGLDADASAQLYLDLADDYLQRGQYDQAANFLQQLLNQHHSLPAARTGLLTLMQLYSSSEINDTQKIRLKNSASADKSATDQAGLCRFALHLANNMLQRNPSLATDPAVTFQRSAAARNANHLKLTKGLLSRLKHNAAVKPWSTFARAEQWLQENQQPSTSKSTPPLAIMHCLLAPSPPHLDGLLTDPLWQSDDPVQLCYDEEFLYLAVRYPKATEATYPTDPRPRTPDADLNMHDHVRLRLDRDRDYATYFELAIDHRGWTADRCWRDKSWNPQWFVAASSDASTWTAEAAIAWDQLACEPPTAGNAWAIAIDRMTPTTTSDPATPPVGAAPSPSESGFRMLLFQ